MYERSSVSNTMVESIDISTVCVCRISRICCFMEERRERRLRCCFEVVALADDEMPPIVVVASFFIVGRVVKYSDDSDEDDFDLGGAEDGGASLSSRTTEEASAADDDCGKPLLPLLSLLVFDFITGTTTSCRLALIDDNGGPTSCFSALTNDVEVDEDDDEVVGNTTSSPSSSFMLGRFMQCMGRRPFDLAGRDVHLVSDKTTHEMGRIHSIVVTPY